tara:strand:+ start:349 stop:1236 length:888 start_codon:yes stop_codon:yes gene_type:complete
MISKSIDVYSLIEPEINKLRKVGIETANLDCRLLLSKSLERELILYNHQNISISENEIKIFQSFIEQRIEGKPVSRIINKRNFWKKEFKLNEATLDPRSDSETLIETFLEQYTQKSKLLKILDLGSGSGCLGLSILDEYYNSNVTFIDISKKSLEIAKINAVDYGLAERSKFIHLDWEFEEWDLKLIEAENNIKFDIIISNPPYIPTDDIKRLQKEVKNYDPLVALNGGKDGLDAYKSILPKLRFVVKKYGKIFLEIGKGQENLVSSIGLENGLIPIKYKKDLSGVNRVITFIVK